MRIPTRSPRRIPAADSSAAFVTTDTASSAYVSATEPSSIAGASPYARTVASRMSLSVRSSAAAADRW
ncbi:MAG: hypothetical protein HHJ14_09595 [Cellulomonas sp.]|nr:hypothetical protein [Cellulomonas sp.]